MKETNVVIRYYKEKLTIFEAAILECVKDMPQYLTEISERLDADSGSTFRTVNRMILKGWLKKEKVPNQTSLQGPPLSALISTDGEYDEKKNRKNKARKNN